jgi:Subtilase family
MFTATFTQKVMTATGYEMIGATSTGMVVDNFYNSTGVLLEQDVYLSPTTLIKYFPNTNGTYNEQMFLNGSTIAFINQLYNSANLELSQTTYSASGTALVSDVYSYNAKNLLIGDIKTTLATGVVDNIVYGYNATNQLATMTHTNNSGFVTEIDTISNGVTSIVTYKAPVTPATSPSTVTAPTTTITTPTAPPSTPTVTPVTVTPIAVTPVATVKLPAVILASTVSQTINLATGYETIGKNALGSEIDNFFNSAGVLLEQDQHVTASLLVKYFLNADGSYSEQMFVNGSTIAQSNMVYSSTGLEQSQTLFSSTGAVITTDTYTYNANKQMLTDVKTTAGIVDNIVYAYNASNQLATMTHTNNSGFVTEIDTFTNGIAHAVYYTPAPVVTTPVVAAPVITTGVVTPTVTLPPMPTVITPTTWSNIAGYGEINFLTALDYATKTTIPVVTSPINIDWNISSTQANSVEAAGYTGKGVVIADIDTGVDLNNKALTSNLSQYDWNFLNNTANVQDDNGHGSFTASEMIATNNDSNGIVGASTGAQLMVLKALDAKGNGSVANIVTAIDYAVDHGANIINMSLGSVIPAPTILAALAYANSHGVLVAVASGNNLGHTPEYPAIYATQLPNIMAVAASQILPISTAPLTYADYSNEAGSNSAYNYVVAPGGSLKGYNQSGQVISDSGTSMASAMVASEMADLIQAYNSIPHTANTPSLDTFVMTAITSTSHPISIVGLQPIPASALMA